MGEEYPYHPVVAQCSLTVWKAREYLHLRTSVEGLEEGSLQCQVDSGDRMFYQHWLEETLVGNRQARTLRL